MTTEAQTKTSSIDRLRDYLRETRVELRKTTWPTREETINLTTVVLVVTLVMTVVLGGLDAFFTWIVGVILQAASGL